MGGSSFIVVADFALSFATVEFSEEKGRKIFLPTITNFGSYL